MTFAALRHLGRQNTARRLYSTASVQGYAAQREAVREHAQQSSQLWFKASIAAIPILMLASYNAYRLLKEHEEHMAHHAGETHIKYPYMMIRNKASERTLFYNPKVNDLYDE
ncbi:cytochrome c oxidase, subunit VIa [Syncephalis pseudoplumigaleata]|uniref:Cytochrome c oxidase, subunit VIa n=1 Tax=Syncephalis pseudoplumigaleata TaxID=1712513 RepID=A0A4P9Z1J1_9FUNG|nr:cytochrome c oxidase, subunit VIa [Syncephalis pseudoplumigaleata]|eukprot:RKP26353.1 cytochrome c oxidase, subunit VIa [Syncephalis pseudoplumigaleata]